MSDAIKKWIDIKEGRRPRLLQELREKKLAREMTHVQQAPLESLKGQDALTDWALGMQDRALHPIRAMADYANEFKGLDPVDMGMQLVGGGMAGTFIGKGAKTFNHAMQEAAQKMEAAGHAPEAIWKETGTFKGADGHWRQEIDDSTAKTVDFDKLQSWGSRTDLKQGNSTVGAVGDFIEHSNLHNAYNGIVDFGDSNNRSMMRVVPGMSGGSFGDELITTGVENGAINKSTTLHELQHAIQEREGWAKGGSPENAPIPYIDELNAVRAEQKALDIDPYKIQNTLAAKFHVPQGDLDKLKVWEGLKSKEDEILQKSLSITPFDQYKRLAGEAEARLTQARMNMTPAQRAASYPPSMFDVPMDQQIVRHK